MIFAVHLFFPLQARLLLLLLGAAPQWILFLFNMKFSTFDVIFSTKISPKHDINMSYPLWTSQNEALKID